MSNGTAPPHVKIGDKHSPVTFLESLSGDAEIKAVFIEDNSGGGGGGQTHIKINAGGQDVSGDWVNDSAYASGGSSYTFGGTHDTSGVTDPAPNAVYQTVRHREHSYHIPVANGNYKVRIHFTEGHSGSKDRRKMKYTIEGQVVLNDYNIYNAAGNVLYKAVIEEFNTTVNDGTLTIVCEYGSGNDVFESGIEVISQ